MQPSKFAIWLARLAGLLALFGAASGLLMQGGGGPYGFTTLHGQAVQIYGQGLYRNDTLFAAGIYKGTDVVTLLAVLPLLVFALRRYRHSSLRGGLLLLGSLAFLLYNQASMALGAAYNPLFLVYVAAFSASLFAFILTWASFDPGELPNHVLSSMPHRRVAVFLIVAGLATSLVWLSEVIGSLLSGEPPATLGSYTTLFTHGLDIAIIMPVTVLGGILLLRRVPAGYLIAPTMLVMCMLIGLVVIGQTIAQYLLGIRLSPAQFTIFVASFVTMSIIAAWLANNFLRSIDEVAPQRGIIWHTVHNYNYK